MALLIRYIAIVVITELFAGPSHADNLRLAEQEIKAGMLYNFLKYTDWPQKSAHITVCTLEENSVSGYLQPMVGRTVNQRAISLRAIQDIRDAAGCHLLFLDAAQKEQWPVVRGFLEGKPVLTVSDFPGFTGSGGMIEFGRKHNRISVDLNMEAVSSAHLAVQDRLLKLVTLAGRRER